MTPEQEAALFENIGSIKTGIEFHGKQLETVLDSITDQSGRLAAVEHAHANGGCNASKELRKQLEEHKAGSASTSSQDTPKATGSDTPSTPEVEEAKALIGAVRWISKHWLKVASSGSIGAGIMYLIDQLIKNAN